MSTSKLIFILIGLQVVVAAVLATVFLLKKNKKK